VKGRKWIPILICAIVLVLGGFTFAIRFLHVDERVRASINETVSRYLGTEFEASSVYILPWSIGVRDARLRLSDTPITVEVERLRITFNLFSLILDFFSTGEIHLPASTRTVFFQEPRFLWHLGEENAGAVREPPLHRKPPLPPSLRISIVDGSLAFARGDSTLILANGIQGELASSPGGLTQAIEKFDMTGRVLSDERNTILSGAFNRADSSFSLFVRCAGCDFASGNLSLLTGDIRPGSGTFDFTISMISDRNGAATIDGSYSVADGSFLLQESGIRFDEVHAEGAISEREILLDSLTGSVLNIRPKISGALKLEQQPMLTLSLDASDISLSSLLAELYPDKETYPAGFLDCAATIEGPLGDLKIRATVSSDSLAYRDIRLKNLTATMGFSGRTVEFETFGADYGGYSIRGRGKVADLITQGSDSPAASDFGLSATAVKRGAGESSSFSLALTGRARPRDNDYNATFTVRLPSGRDVSRNAPPDDIGEIVERFNTLKGSLHLADDALSFAVENDYVGVTGTADRLFDGAAVAGEFTVRGLPVPACAGIGGASFILDGGGAVTGGPDRLVVDGDYRVTGENLDTRFTANTIVENALLPSRTLYVKADLYRHHLRYSHAMNWRVTASVDPSAATLTVSEPSGADLWVTASHDTGELDGALRLSDFPLEWIIDIFKRESFSHRGVINGVVEIGGTVRDPLVRSPEPLTVTGLNIGGLDDLTGVVDFSGGLDELNFTDAKIRRHGIHIMSADGRWKRGEPFVVEAGGSGIAFEAIGDLISDDRAFDGRADYDFTMVFTRKNGTIDGSFEVVDGHFYDVPFDRMAGKLGGGSTGFHATDFTAEKKGVFTGRGTASSGYFWKDRTEQPGLKMDIFFEGDLARSLPYLTSAVHEATGKSRLNLTIGGTWVAPAVLAGELHVTDGIIKPAFLVDKVSDVSATLSIDPSFETVTGMRAVRILSASGTILGKRLILSNIHVGDDDWETIERPGLLPVINGALDLDFGVITGRIDKGGYRDTSLALHIPGFMKPNDTGTFILSGVDNESFIIGASDTGYGLSPYLTGTITILSGDVYYPLLEVNKTGKDMDFLHDIFWDLTLHAGANVNYAHEDKLTLREITESRMSRKLGNLSNNPFFSALGDMAGTTVTKTLARLEENSVFTVFGRLSDDSFRVTGNASSRSGTISYYGTEFDIERADLELDTANTNMPTILTVRAKTVVYNDSTDVETEIYLIIHSIDRETGQRRETVGGVDVMNKDDYLEVNTNRTIDAGALGLLLVEFRSNNPSDDTQEKILARLGISADNFVNAATGAITAGVDNYYFDPLMRPFEDVVKKYTRLDVVRFTPTFLGNIVRSQLGYSNRFAPENEYLPFDRSRIMLGEYLFKDWFLSYRGQYGVGRDFLRRNERGFFHEVALQYLIKGNTRVQLNYNYDDIISKSEKSIEIRHDFEFD